MVANPQDVKNYPQIAIDYAREAVRDKKGKKHGLLIRQAAQRFLDDLKRAKRKSCAFFFSEWHATDVCSFIEKLPHIEGKWETPTIVLHPFQIFFLVQLFGFRLRDGVEIERDGSLEIYYPRRFTSAVYAIGRKNAKSTIAGGILLYCICCEPEEGAQILTAATTYDQASIIFKMAKRMVEKTPDLAEHFGLETWAKTITRMEMGSVFKPIHAKASTQDGLNPSHTALDEIHAHKTPDLLNVLTSAAGARLNSLWLYTTTEGYTNPGPWADLKPFCKNLLSGVFGDSADHFLAVMFACDEANKTLKIKADDEFDENNWIKANPLMEFNPHLKDAIRKAAVEAKAMPSKKAEFRIKRCNLPASSAEGWINLVNWRQCAGKVDLDWLEEYPCFAGMDLASTSDLAAFRLLWIVEGKWYTYGLRWCPEDSVAYRTERGTVPYASWVESGILRQTEGNRVDYAVIEKDIIDLYERFRIQQIAYDRWNAIDLVNRLVDQDLPMIEFVQGPKSYHPAMQALEIPYMGGNLAHGGDPLLEWCAANLVVRYDQNLNMAPDKRRSADKIDDMTALLMAAGIATGPKEKEPDYSLVLL